MSTWVKNGPLVTPSTSKEMFTSNSVSLPEMKAFLKAIRFTRALRD